MRRVAFRSLLFVGIPAYIAMAIGAQWLYDKEFGDVEEDPAWIGIGFIIARLGGLLLLIATISPASRPARTRAASRRPPRSSPRSP